MERLSPLSFESLQDYLKVVRVQAVGESRRRRTFSEWSSLLGMNSSRTAGMVFTGKRLPSPQLLMGLSSILGLKDSEYRYLDLLVQLERCKRTGKNPERVLNEISAKRERQAIPFVLTEAKFRYLSDWYVLVIKQLVETPDFQPFPQWIHRRLRGKVSTKQAAQALEILARLGIIRRRKGKWVAVAQNVTNNVDVPSETVRMHHKQMMLRAEEAMHEQSVDRRELDSKVFRFDPARLEEAKTWLRNSRLEFLKKFESSDSNHVFQLNSQFFEHTFIPKENA